MIYLRLFYEFFKTGLFAIGGGLATIPFLTEIGQKTNWYSMQELSNMIAISESTPGPIGVNMATYVGFKVAGPLGALISTLGEVCPCVLIILLLSKTLIKNKDNFYISNALKGIRAVCFGLIFYAFFNIFINNVLNDYSLINSFIDLFELRKIIIFLIILICCLLYKKGHPIIWIVLSAILGILLF